jgi:hypothetical protein
VGAALQAKDAEAAVSSLPVLPCLPLGLTAAHQMLVFNERPSILASVEGQEPKRTSMRSGTAWERMLDAFIMSIWDNDKPFINYIDRKVLHRNTSRYKRSALRNGYFPSRCSRARQFGRCAIKIRD